MVVQTELTVAFMICVALGAGLQLLTAVVVAITIVTFAFMMLVAHGAGLQLLTLHAGYGACVREWVE